VAGGTVIKMPPFSGGVIFAGPVDGGWRVEVHLRPALAHLSAHFDLSAPCVLYATKLALEHKLPLVLMPQLLGVD
jgi:hypothetical protein